ncbi:MAG: DNA methyltransferase [Planctomycetota bacterium]
MTLEKNQIHQGDCVRLLEKLEPGSVDLVFADPPFNIGYEYDVYEDQQSTDDYLDWCQKWMGGVYRALKSDGTFWLAIGDEYAAELKIESQKAGFHCRSWVIWYYTFGVNCANGFSRSHTHLFHFVKNPKKFTFVRANPNIRIKSARQMVYADLRANPNGRLPDNTWITRPQDIPESFRANDDTWFFSRVAGTFKEREGFHGCQMPEQVLARIIRASSYPHDLVLDPFGGSGTTLTVAKKLARNWIGFELSQDYVKHINQRINAVKMGEPIEGPQDPIENAIQTSGGKRRKKKEFNQKTIDAVLDSFQQLELKSLVPFLCENELSQQFFQNCKQRKLGASAIVWNRFLVELTTSGQLEGIDLQGSGYLDLDEVQPYLLAAEIALRLVADEFRLPGGQPLSLLDIFSSPDTAEYFDLLASQFGTELEDEDPVNYRKAAFIVQNREDSFQTGELPALDHWKLTQSTKTHEKASVFLLARDDLPIFIGSTDNPGGSVGVNFDSAGWKKLEPLKCYVLENVVAEWDLQQVAYAAVRHFRPILNKVPKEYAINSNWVPQLLTDLDSVDANHSDQATLW